MTWVSFCSAHQVPDPENCRICATGREVPWPQSYTPSSPAVRMIRQLREGLKEFDIEVDMWTELVPAALALLKHQQAHIELQNKQLDRWRGVPFPPETVTDAMRTLAEIREARARFREGLVRPDPGDDEFFVEDEDVAYLLEQWEVNRDRIHLTEAPEERDG